MCLRVQAGGQMKGHGSHVSVFVHLMHGESDDFLVWPFYGNVVVELMNQRKDGWHLRKTIPFDNSVMRSSDETTCAGSYWKGIWKLRII